MRSFSGITISPVTNEVTEYMVDGVIRLETTQDLNPKRRIQVTKMRGTDILMEKREYYLTKGKGINVTLARGVS